jgi:DNA-binding NtrC family response regulator
MAPFRSEARIQPIVAGDALTQEDRLCHSHTIHCRRDGKGAPRHRVNGSIQRRSPACNTWKRPSTDSAAKLPLVSATQEALVRHRNNRRRAAAELGISRMGLYKKLHKYGLMDVISIGPSCVPDSIRVRMHDPALGEP